MKKITLLLAATALMFGTAFAQDHGQCCKKGAKGGACCKGKSGHCAKDGSAAKTASTGKSDAKKSN